MKSAKNLDVFQSPIGFKMSRGREGVRKTTYKYYFQSYFGLFCSAIAMLNSISYLQFLIHRMIRLDDDSYSSQRMMNLEDTDETRQLNLGSYDFYPIIQISALGDITPFGIQSILKEKTSHELDIDLDQFKRYVVPEYGFYTRDGGKMTTHIIPSVMCAT
jgi:hypothetical protein